MAWTDPGAHIWTTSEVVTAANMNTYVRLNLSFLGSTSTATVTTSETKTGGTYGDLATSGPAVTITTGTKALVIVNATFNNNTSGGSSLMGYAVSGATTIAAGDVAGFISASVANSIVCSGSAVSTLNAGSNTFTAKYRAAGGDVAAFQNRVITVIPLP